MSTFEELSKPAEPLPDILLDRSDLQDVAECPHRYQLAKKLKRPLNSDMATVGTIVHELIEEAFDAHADDNIADVADYVAEELPKQRPDLQPEVLRAGKWIANYLLRINQTAVIGYEQQINVTLFPATASRGPVKATACADLVMHGAMASYEIWDWKSGWKMRTETDVRSDFQAQMLTWLWWQNVPDAREVQFTFIETRTGGKASATFFRDQWLDGMRTITQEAAFGARVAEAARLMLTGSDEAWPSPGKCAWCDYADVCKCCDYRVIDIAEDPARYLEQYIVTEQVQKERHKLIGEWLRAGKTLATSQCAARVQDRPSRFGWKIEAL